MKDPKYRVGDQLIYLDVYEQKFNLGRVKYAHFHEGADEERPLSVWIYEFEDKNAAAESENDVLFNIGYVIKKLD